MISLWNGQGKGGRDCWGIRIKVIKVIKVIEVIQVIGCRFFIKLISNAIFMCFFIGFSTDIIYLLLDY